MAEAEAREFEIKEQKVEDNVLTMKVEVGKQVVSGAFKRVHRIVAGQVKVPGFRSGKIPMPVLVNHVGKDNFLKEVRRELLPHFYYTAIEELSQRPISNVTFEDESLTQGEVFSFSAKVAVSPRVELAEYDSMQVEKPGSVEVQDSEIDERINVLRGRFAKTEAAPDKKAESGDLALVNIDVTIDGEEYQTLSRRNVTMELGKNQYLEGFDAQVVGHGKGEVLEFPMKLEGEKTPEHLRGKDAAFKVTLKAVRTSELPAIADDFAKDLGFTDLAALREKLTADLKGEKSQKSEGEAVKALQKALISQVSVEPPKETVESRIDDYVIRVKEQAMKKGVSFETMLKEQGKTEDQLRQETQETVVEELKLEFALDAVAEREDIKVSDEEVEHRVMAMARMMGKKAEEVMDMLDQAGSRILTKQDIVREHALERLKAKVLGISEPEGHEGHDHHGHHQHSHG